MSDYDKEEIHDEDDTQAHNAHYLSTGQKQNFQTEHQPQKQVEHQHEQKHEVSHHQAEEHHQVHQHQHEQNKYEQKHFQNTTKLATNDKSKIDHVGIGKYASFTLDVEDDQKNQVYLRIVGNQTKGSAFTKYTAYIIKGHDKNGEVTVYRRFSQFHALRLAMVHRWPGCFIPSIPPKNIMHKNDKDETIKRERYLNDFVIKMTKLPYLYNSEQFQTFLRSKEVDTSNIYSSWSQPTNQGIINKYRDCFRDLEGKQIDSGTNNTIGHFYARIKKNAALLQKYRLFAKNLALSYDKFQHNYPIMFSKIIPTYEKQILMEYTNGKEAQLVYQNSQEAKLNEQAAIITETTNKNPYWALYDMIKHEERDGRAFLEALDARESLESKRNSIDGKIRDNQKSIFQLMEGKTNLKSVTSKGTKEEVKYKLEVQNQELKKQKNMLLILSDIISALIVYIEIPAYQFAKINFYNKTLKKIGGYELNAVQVQADAWKDTFNAALKIGQKFQQGL